jgi:hypothetical protein
MPQVQGVDVAIGDYLRCNSDQWGGTVTELDDETLILDMGPSVDPRTLGYEEVHWDDWSPKSPTPTLSIPVLCQQVNDLNEVVNQMLLDQLMGGL